MPDFRSDTLTKPCKGMRQAMYDAEVGDDVYVEDPTVNALEKHMLEQTGWGLPGTDFHSGGALFCPCTTQSNTLAIMCNTGRGDEVIIAEHGHSYYYETAAGSVFAGIIFKTLPTYAPNAIDSVSTDDVCLQEKSASTDDSACKNAKEDFDKVPGAMSLSAIQAVFKAENVHFPRTRMVVVENTHMGLAIPVSYFKALREMIDAHNETIPNINHHVKIHCDGARIMNACVRNNVPLKEYTQYLDSLAMCFSKGLGSPCGSMLFIRKPKCENSLQQEPSDILFEARKWRKAMGGGLRQVGVIAAPCRYAYDNNYPKVFQADHENAAYLAKQLLERAKTSESVKKYLKPDLYDKSYHTNMLFFRFQNVPEDKIEKLHEEFMAKMDEKNVKIGNPKYTQGSIRLVTHLDITAEDCTHLIGALVEFCETVIPKVVKA